MMNTLNTEFSSVEVCLETKLVQHLRLLGRHYKMRYSTEPRCRRYVEGNGFLSFARKFSDKYGKTLIDTATKTRIDATKMLLNE